MLPFISSETEWMTEPYQFFNDKQLSQKRSPVPDNGKNCAPLAVEPNVSESGTIKYASL